MRADGQVLNLLIGAAGDSGYLTDAFHASTLSSEYSQLEPENEIRFGLLHLQPTTYTPTPDRMVRSPSRRRIR
jgi:hypothetical protein